MGVKNVRFVWDEEFHRAVKARAAQEGTGLAAFVEACVQSSLDGKAPQKAERAAPAVEPGSVTEFVPAEEAVEILRGRRAGWGEKNERLERANKLRGGKS